MQFSTIFAAATWVALSTGTPVERASDIAKCLTAGNCSEYPALQTAVSAGKDCIEKCKGKAIASCVIQNCDNKALVDALKTAVGNSDILMGVKVPEALAKGRDFLRKAVRSRINKRELERRGLKDALKKGVNKAKDLGKKGVEKAKEIAQAVAPTIKKSVGDAAKDVGKSIADSAKTAASNAYNNAKESIQTNGLDAKALANSVGNGLKNDAREGAKAAGSQAVAGAKAGVKATANGVKDHLTQKNTVGEQAEETVGEPEEEYEGEESQESEDDEEFVDVDLEKRDLKSSFRNLADKAKNAVVSGAKDNLDNFKSAGKTIVNAGVNTLKGTVKDVRGDLKNNEKITVGKVGSSIVNNARQQLPEVKNSVVGAAKSFGSGVVNNLRGKENAAPAELEQEE